MEEDKDLLLFFKNIQIVFKKYSLKELNKALLETLNRKGNKVNETDFVFQTVAYHYNIAINKIKAKYTRGKFSDAKQMCYCLLHFNLGIPKSQIAKNIFDTWANTVEVGINRFKRCNPDIKCEKEFLETYEQLSKIVDKFILENNQKNKQ